jgi:hypothetical protein
MFRKQFDRILSLCIVAGFIAWYITGDIVRKISDGKDGYLRYESAFFDRHYSKPYHPVSSGIGYFIFIAAFFVTYEGIAFLLRLIRSRKGPKED